MVLYPLRRTDSAGSDDHTADSRAREDVPGPMTTGTMHMGGFAAGAARPGTCPLAIAYPGTAASLGITPWHDGSNGKQESVVFATDRPTRRPLERFP